MLGRLFGKNKDASGEAVCAECGRTLLAGEWTQKLVDDDGNEVLLCSLCGRAHSPADGERLQVKGGTGAALAAGHGADEAGDAGDRVESGRDENAALWKAIKDRDAQIESLRAELARGETERQELLGRLARLQAAAPAAAAIGQPAAAEVGDTQAEPAAQHDEAESPAAARPDLFTLADEAVEAAVEETPPEAADDSEAAAAVAAEDTAEILAAGPTHDVAPDADATPEAGLSAAPTTQGVAEAEAEVAATADVGAGPEAALEAEAQASSMTLLQRGVDLLNVSPVPRKIAETNADLGIPTVHVGYDGETPTVTFMWSMGWYRFAVDVDSGGVSLGDRGYEERDDLQPNAGVRADGTVQLAAARISRAAAQRAQSAPEEAASPEPRAEEPSPVEEPTPVEKPEAETTPPVSGPEILSKSLLGQRTDDERPSWERTQARDFDWDH